MAPLPQRLFHLLKLAEENGWEDIVSWVNDGTGFKVHDREKFEKLLLQKYFNTARYASFARQLHAYGFGCVRTGRQTGIYSHPNFKRDDPKASCALKREAGKKISKSPISSRSQEGQDNKGLGVRFAGIRNGILAGDTIVQFPSLLETPSERFVGISLYKSVCSKVASRTRTALIRIPSEATDRHLPFNSTGREFWSATAAGVASMNDASRMQMVADVPKSSDVVVSAKDCIVRDGGLIDTTTLPLKTPLKDYDLFQEDEDWDPVPWSPTDSSSEEDDEDEFGGSPSQLDSSLEPRPVGEMVQNPDSLNEWLYDSVPMFDTPRKRAILEFSLPLSLPLGFYLLDVSTYGICWVTFLVLGHLIQCLMTSWGGAADNQDKTYTKDLSIRPTIGMLQHHIMDLLWFHFLLSNMILTPQYFGPPCFPLLYIFIWPQPFNLCIVIKTHYCESNLEGTYSHGKWWIGDLVKNVLVGYFLTILGVFLLHYYGMDYLRIPLVFGFNMIPLFIFESYRYLVSIPTILVVPRRGGVSDVKKRN